MIICKNCGVELDAEMESCPLCGQPVSGASDKSNKSLAYGQQSLQHARRMTAPQKKITWEIISLILLSAVVATFIVNFIINKKITWSEYPAAISFVIFSYISLFAFWRQRTLIQMLAGFLLSSASIIVIDIATGGISWALYLGLPMLLALNIVIAALITIIQSSKFKGINLLAWAFLGAAILCICIEGILSYYETESLRLNWSIITGGCIIPVVLVLIFVHFRLKKGRNLERTFHV